MPRKNTNSHPIVPSVQTRTLHTHMHTHMHTHTHTHARTRTHIANIPSHANASTYISLHQHTNRPTTSTTHQHTYPPPPHTHTHTHTHTRTHTHIHTSKYIHMRALTNNIAHPHTQNPHTHALQRIGNNINDMSSLINRLLLSYGKKGRDVDTFHELRYTMVMRTDKSATMLPQPKMPSQSLSCMPNFII